MPPRKKPQSAKQHKARLQLKRAVKRGDIAPDEIPAKPRKPQTRRQASTSADDPSSKIAAVRRLQSSFATLSSAFLEQSKVAAGRGAFQRPIPPEVAVWSTSSGRIAPEREEELNALVSCLKRPKWRHDMSKKEVRIGGGLCARTDVIEACVPRSNTTKKGYSENGSLRSILW
jgi:hypothetical protein